MNTNVEKWNPKAGDIVLAWDENSEDEFVVVGVYKRNFDTFHLVTINEESPKCFPFEQVFEEVLVLNSETIKNVKSIINRNKNKEKE